LLLLKLVSLVPYHYSNTNHWQNVASALCFRKKVPYPSNSIAASKAMLIQGTMVNLKKKSEGSSELGRSTVAGISINHTTVYLQYICILCFIHLFRDHSSIKKYVIISPIICELLQMLLYLLSHKQQIFSPFFVTEFKWLYWVHINVNICERS
jgi:hypothetical protein